VYNQNTCLQRTYYYNIENAAIEVPNFFSPNGDKVNDLFGPVLTNMIKEDVVIDNLKIHNRWGKEVYSSNQMWDGMIKGQSAPSEVYYFTLTYSAGNGCRHTVKGDVTLMK
jgi:gliding motility-associated-like protein